MGASVLALSNLNGNGEAIVKGNLRVFTGCMFTRKSLELIESIKLVSFKNLPYLAISPIREEIFSRGSKDTIPAIMIDKGHPEIISYVIGFKQREMQKKGDTRVLKHVFIDEVQFYGNEITSIIEGMLDQGIDVTVAGLDQDFRGKPFGPMGDLLTLAFEIQKHHTVCMKCKKNKASKSQRLINGHPAPVDGPLVVVDNEHDEITYEARCIDCHVKG